jgi:hypothetical protein
VKQPLMTSCSLRPGSRHRGTAPSGKAAQGNP